MVRLKLLKSWRDSRSEHAETEIFDSVLQKTKSALAISAVQSKIVSSGSQEEVRLDLKLDLSSIQPGTSASS